MKLMIQDDNGNEYILDDLTYSYDGDKELFNKLSMNYISMLNRNERTLDLDLLNEWNGEKVVPEKLVWLILKEIEQRIDYARELCDDEYFEDAKVTISDLYNDI